MKRKRNNVRIFKLVFLIFFILLMITSGIYSKINGNYESQIKNNDNHGKNSSNPKLSSFTSNAIDLTKPSAKYLTGIDHYYGSTRDVFLYDDLAFVVTDCGDLLIFNLTNFNPEIIGIWENKLFGPEIETTGFQSKIVIKNSTAYIGLQDLGMVLINVSNPLLPLFIDHYQSIKIHDLAIKQNKLYAFYRNYNLDIDTLTVFSVETQIPKFLFNVSDNFVFIREIIMSHGFIFKQLESSTKIFDIFQGVEIIEIGEIEHKLDAIAIRNKILIGSSSNNQMLFFNITNIANPSILGNLSLPYYYYFGATISQNLIFIWNTWDIFTINFTDITNPQILGKFGKPMHSARLIALNGFVEIVDERLMMYVNHYYGIFIYNFTIADNPTVVGSYIDIRAPREIAAKNDVLLICLDKRVEIYSVENKEKPILHSVYEVVGTIFDVEIYDDYAILALGSKGIEIIDLIDTKNPERICYFNNFSKISFNHYFTFCLSIDYTSKVLYISKGHNGIAILNISDCSKPEIINEFNPNDSGATAKIVYHSGRLYVGTEGIDWSLGSFIVYDVSEPKEPIKLYEIRGIDYVSEFCINEGYLYMYMMNFFSSIKIFDLRKEISYSSNISSINGLYRVKEIYVQNNIAFISHRLYPSYCMSTIDVKNKKNPRIIDEYHGQSSTSFITGIIIDKDILYINEGWNGIQIFHIENWSYKTIELNFISISFSFVIIALIVFKKKKKKVINC